MSKDQYFSIQLLGKNLSGEVIGSSEDINVNSTILGDNLKKQFKINSDILAVEALSILEKNNISALPVLDKSKITGIVTMQNIIKSIN